MTEQKIKKAPKPKEDKLDILGQILIEGCYVAAPRSNMLKVCQITKLSAKMVHVKSVNKTGYKDEFMTYPDHVVRLDGPDALAYILKAK